MKTFDLIVIGSGAGLNVATGAAEEGLKVAIIEDSAMGGTCLNRGCIPSNIVIHSAEVAEMIHRASEFGISAKGNKIVIAAGARPSIPPIPGLDKVPYMTSTEALRQTSLPKSMIIIGGGYIAVELGFFYAELGTKMTILQRNEVLIPREDKEIAGLITELWKKKHTVFTSADVVKVEKQGKKVAVTVKVGNATKKIIAEKLLVATGVKPNSDTLQLGKTGVKINDKGFISVNRFMETNVKNI